MGGGLPEKKKKKTIKIIQQTMVDYTKYPLKVWILSFGTVNT